MPKDQKTENNSSISPIHGWPQWVDRSLSDFISGKNLVKSFLLASFVFALYEYFFGDKLATTIFAFLPKIFQRSSQNPALNMSIVLFLIVLSFGGFAYLYRLYLYLKTKLPKVPVVGDYFVRREKELFPVSTEIFSASGEKKERQINIPGKELSGLRVYFSTNSDHWRLGIRLDDQTRFLDFHLYKDGGGNFLNARYIYTNDNNDRIDDRELEITSGLDNLSFGYSRGQENYMLLIYRGEKIIWYKTLLDLSADTYFNQGKIVAWGDGNPYEITINQTVISGRQIKLTLEDKL